MLCRANFREHPIYKQLIDFGFVLREGDYRTPGSYTTPISHHLKCSVNWGTGEPMPIYVGIYDMREFRAKGAPCDDWFFEFSVTFGASEESGTAHTVTGRAHNSNFLQELFYMWKALGEPEWPA